MTVDVLVVGSLHRDVIVTAPRLPSLDETLTGSGVRFALGGKGGNQAVAARRMGARTAMLGSVGADEFGAELIAALDVADVDRMRVAVLPATPSGMSVAIVDEHGDYGAVIVSGANLMTSPADAVRAMRDTRPRVLLLQNEISAETNRAAAAEAAAHGGLVIWNAAPVREADPGLLGLASLIVVNRIEAGLAVEPAASVEETIAAARGLAAGKRHAIVTLGGEGAIHVGRDGTAVRVPAIPTAVASTHGAGDMFVGALAARLAGGAAVVDALVFANAAAALFVGSDDSGRGSLDATVVDAFIAGDPGEAP